MPSGKVVKSSFGESGARADVSFETMEVDQDHMQCVVKSEPGISPLAMVHRLKHASPFRLWRTYEKDVQRHVWKERTFWSDGYFCCTIGNASEEAIRHYIANRG
jgi:putative transposase